MSCDRFQQALDAWDPAGTTPLSDELALHLDACPACRAAFDARLPPVHAMAGPELRVAVPSGARPMPAALGLAAVAAAVLISAAPRPAPATADDAVADAMFRECLVMPAWPASEECDL